ncbi:MAG: ChaB family protein [Thermoplasmatota archaeon]
MIADVTGLPKPAKALPEDAQQLFVDTYNKDFGWRHSEAHAEKAAWRIVLQRFEEREDGTWAKL